MCNTVVLMQNFDGKKTSTATMKSGLGKFSSPNLGEWFDILTL